MNSHTISCDLCGFRMTVTDRRRLLCDECAEEAREADHVPPWQVHG